ncbi:MAG: hypothetical protein PHU97_07755 [Bacteroidales bacterium]|nr:hypothetical protein [Bacteroidales bacterium]MDD2323305.1 hypothetical protein [Bacteroidales bacterium]MDD3011197.1 hypothetical protein [Bacteroidales bacterium]MDD3961444.1 hypothetical protein [Bacteroidales bacterium]MDY0285882.1 hypothetical protein [Bacteroidales bacterium]
MKNSIVAIVLIILLEIPFSGSILWLHQKKHQIRKQVKKEIIAGIDPEKLIQLKFSLPVTDPGLKWIHNKEFEYKGEMYDIVSVQNNGDSIVYLCWWDHQETVLNRQLGKLVKKALNNEPGNTRTQEQLTNYFVSLYFHEQQQYKPDTFSDNPSGFRELSVLYHRLSPAPPTPPPRFFMMHLNA